MSDLQSLIVSIQQAGPIPLAADLSCEAGEMVALVGPSGAGKTTMLRSIAGLYEPDAGRITCAGDVWFDSELSINTPPHHRRVGLVFQSYALFPHMTALRNLTVALAHRPAAERVDRARSLLRLVHLDGLGDRRPAALSGGQQQRLAVARALAREPDVLLLDEPFSAVDRRTRRALHDELRQLRNSVLVPIVLVTHDLDEAVALADHICVLDGGETLQKGRPADVLAHPVNDRVRNALDILEGHHDGRRAT